MNAPIRVYGSCLGSTISFVKTNFMVVGKVVSDEVKCNHAVGDDLIEWVEYYPYLGSLILKDGKVSGKKNSKYF